MQTKAIIFDFFGVFTPDIATIWFKKHFSEEEAKQLKDLYFQPVDVGKFSLEESLKQMSLLVKTSPESIKQEFLNSINIDHSLVGLVKKIKTKYKIGLCTNSPSNFMHSILDQYQLTDLFDEIIISSEVKIAKPDPKIFQLMLEKLECEPNKAIFIDDNPKNITAAVNLGIKSILFNSTDQLTKELLYTSTI